MITPKKALGQHWLTEPLILQEIAAAAQLTSTDTVVEVGPGLGTLTAVLSAQVQQVLAVELDEALAQGLTLELQRQSVTNVTVLQADILRFDWSQLPPHFKIVANIPYYLTSHLLRIITELKQPPQMAVLLMQKEVAERVCAEPGDMSVLAVAVQNCFTARLGVIVPPTYFTPPPKVDSQLLILERRPVPLVADDRPFMRLVKISFAAKRKLLTNTLSAGYRVPKADAAAVLESAGLSTTVRAEELSLDDWPRLLKAVQAAAWQ